MTAPHHTALDYAETRGYKLRGLLVDDLIMHYLRANETTRYLQSDKFNNDTTVQVGDVIQRLAGL